MVRHARGKDGRPVRRSSKLTMGKPAIESNPLSGLGRVEGWRFHVLELKPYHSISGEAYDPTKALRKLQIELDPKLWVGTSRSRQTIKRRVGVLALHL